MTSKTPTYLPVETRIAAFASRYGGGVEAVYAGILLLALTQGPVLSIWLRSVQPGELVAERAIDSTYLFVQVPAVALLARRLRPGVLAARPALLVATLALFLALSTTWSVLRADTIVAATALVATTAAGMYLAATFPLRRLLLITCVAMQPGLLASELAVRHKWFAAVDDKHSWAGIYFNRNSLGPPAAIGLLTALLLGIAAFRRRTAHRPLVLVVLLAVVVYDGRLLYLSGSATSFTLVAVATFVFAVGTVAANRFGDYCTPRLAHRIGALYIAVLCALAVLVYGLRDQVSSWLHRPAGFDGRTPYWDASLRGFRVHPLRGWGWLAAWHAPDFKALVPEVLKTEIWSHSAYLDVALGGGIIAVLLLTAVLVYGFGNAAEVSITDRELGGWSLAVATGVAVASTQESFMIGNHFLWALFVAATVIRIQQTPLANPADTLLLEPGDQRGTTT